MADSAKVATFAIKGARELIEELKLFGPDVAAAAIKDGVGKAARELATATRRAAYAGAPKTPKGFKGTLRKAIRAVVGKRGDGFGKAWVGLKRIRGESRVRFYYKTLEFGRKPSKRTDRKRGKHQVIDRFRRPINRWAFHKSKVAGSQHPLRPFFAAAWRANRERIAQTIVDATRAAVFVRAGKTYARTRAAR